MNISIQNSLIELLDKYHDSMVNSFIDILNEIVDENFTLEHITGYVQVKDEWFYVIENKQFNYHNINIDKNKYDISYKNNFATIKGRGIFNATINGMHNDWKLEFNINCSNIDNKMKILNAKYKIY